MMQFQRFLPTIVAMIPVAQKDIDNVSACVKGILKHSLNPVREVFVIGAASLRGRLPTDVSVTWVDEEEIYPGLDDVRAALYEVGYRHDSSTWYFQQILKLSAFTITQPAADHILIHDADVALVQDTLFVDWQGRSLLAYGYPLHWQLHTRRHALPTQHSALAAAARLVPGWKPVDAYSGMQHHIVLERGITQELFGRVQAHHGVEFWRAFISCVEKTKWHGISEYVIYRHFAVSNFPEIARSIHLNSVDIIECAATGRYGLVETLQAAYPTTVRLVGCHKFADYKGTLATMDYVTRGTRIQSSDSAPPPLALLLDQGLLRIEALDPAPAPGAAMRLFAGDSSAPDVME
ncbi:DUF6492 family protein [Streptomyces roseus]|uniref:DUF6492 family protein n=1 Tax=Streptomyces roseus TaxID=66430 RepID=UPI0037F7A331